MVSAVTLAVHYGEELRWHENPYEVPDAYWIYFWMKPGVSIERDLAFVLGHREARAVDERIAFGSSWPRRDSCCGWLD